MAVPRLRLEELAHDPLADMVAVRDLCESPLIPVCTTSPCPLPPAPFSTPARSVCAASSDGGGWKGGGGGAAAAAAAVAANGHRGGRGGGAAEPEAKNRARKLGGAVERKTMSVRWSFDAIWKTWAGSTVSDGAALPRRAATVRTPDKSAESEKSLEVRASGGRPGKRVPKDGVWVYRSAEPHSPIVAIRFVFVCTCVICVREWVDGW